jgi:hypothetical protein
MKMFFVIFAIAFFPVRSFAMTKADLKAAIAQMDALGIADAAVMKYKVAVDNSLHDFQSQNFDAKGTDATYSIDASGHWAAAVSQANTVILKE